MKGTKPQKAFLRIRPDSDTAVVPLTSGGQRHDLFVELFTDIIRDLFALDVPQASAPPTGRKVFAGYEKWARVYENTVLRLDYADTADGRPGVTVTMRGGLAK